MGIITTELALSKEVASSTEESVSHIPISGSFYIEEFYGEAAFDTNCVVKLVWDYGSANEELIWSTKGSGKMPFATKRTGDGVKKLALCLENSLAGPVNLSGFVKIIQDI